MQRKARQIKFQWGEGGQTHTHTQTQTQGNCKSTDYTGREAG